MANVWGACFCTWWWKAWATRSSASSQVAGRCAPFSRMSGWVKRPLADVSIGDCPQKIRGLICRIYQNRWAVEQQNIVTRGVLRRGNNTQRNFTRQNPGEATSRRSEGSYLQRAVRPKTLWAGQLDNRKQGLDVIE